MTKKQKIAYLLTAGFKKIKTPFGEMLVYDGMVKRDGKVKQ